tara:strand:+ start:3521 stop:4042 length:522 start_codon:yes stop_codon:yes gene_type:complete
MAFLLNGKPLAVDVPFTVGETNYPANWLRLTSKAEKEAIGIKEVDDPKIYDSRFYWGDGTAKALDDKTETIDGVEYTTQGVKSVLKAKEKETAGSLLAKYDWYVVRKVEKSTAIPTTVQTFRDQVRTACDTREKEIDACKDTADLVTLYGATYDKDGNFEKYNMTQYPEEVFN